MKKKKLLTGMLATVLSMSMICSNVNMAQAQEVTQTQESTQVQETTQTQENIILNDATGIPDKSLYDAILQQADRDKDGVLTIEEAEKVSSVTIKKENPKVESLEGIQYCKNMVLFGLRDSKLNDISPLAQLSKLVALDLSNTQISDISALRNLTKIRELDLSNNNISDISALAGLTYCEDFNLSNNNISDITPLANLKLAYVLDLSNNNISDITPLANLKNDAEYDYYGGLVDISNNQIRDITSLDTFKATGGSVKADGNPIGESEPVILNDKTGIPDKNLYNAILKEVDSNQDGILSVEEAQELYELNAENAEIEDLTGIGYCPNVYCLFLSNNQITDLTPLESFEKLSELWLDDNQISDISSLKDLKITVTLCLANNQISDISALSHLKGNLFQFDLSGNNISDISVLNPEFVPTILDLSNNQINDISILSNLTNSWYLTLSNNKISDISVLNPNLEVGHLDLANNQIKDITPLSTMTIKTTLDLSNNQIRDISALDAIKEYGCQITTDGNPIGQPEEEKPSDEQKPSDSTKPETSNKPIYNANDFAELLEKQDVVVKPNDYVTITFKKGSSLNDTEKTQFDFTTTVTTNFTNAKLPAFIKENSFITKISYTYCGVLPSKANIQIFVGENYNGKEVFYFSLNEDGTFNKNEVQKVNVENGFITVTQTHCSDYVVTTENPETLYKQNQTQDNNNNNETNNNESSPQTSHDVSTSLIVTILISASALIVLGMRKYKKA